MTRFRPAAWNILAALLIAVLLTVPAAIARAAEDTLTIDTQSGAVTIQVEFAVTPQQRAQGLMFRQSLAPDAGMLFDFGAPVEVTMWMKNTYISLDMIFIRADGIIHRIERNTEPHSLATISSNGDVKGVLEVPAGTARRLEIRPGDRVNYSIFGATGQDQ